MPQGNRTDKAKAQKPLRLCKHCQKTGHYAFQCQLNPKKSVKHVQEPKPCKYCNEPTHYAFQCTKNPYLKIYGWKGSKGYNNPKANKPLKTRGKVFLQWKRTRTQWFIENPAEYYTCYLCSKSMMPYETTLDHVLPRSKRPDLRYEFSNLRPCCWECNTIKGSKIY